MTNTTSLNNNIGEEKPIANIWISLITVLNTVSLPEGFHTDRHKLESIRVLIDTCAKENLYFTCQCIVYSRCLGKKLRPICHIASIFIAPLLSGEPYAKKFYSLWDPATQTGGVIYRPDDMYEIMRGYTTLDPSSSKLTNAMKKGFKQAIESLSSQLLIQYRSCLYDVINLVHPNSSVSGQTTQIGGTTYYTLDAIMKGLPISETWDTPTATESESFFDAHEYVDKAKTITL